MTLKKILKKLSVFVAVILLINTASCGFILYPERRGQTGGRIDPGVAILDAILFLPGLFPGVIAFAVDFVTGAIYLPGGNADLDSEDVMRMDSSISGDPALSLPDITAFERILSEKTGRPVHLKASDFRVLRINDPDYIKRHFTQIATDKKGLLCRK